ncbi:MAG TPA: ATP-binding protein [Candidatus Polarisedimenticolaceae bacterium]
MNPPPTAGTHESADAALARRVGELRVIREIAESLHTAPDLAVILRTILVGATAGQGLRFNRAFLVLVDAARGELRGADGIGPADHEEATRVWGELDARPRSLRELLTDYGPLLEGSSGGAVRGIVDRLRVPLADGDAFLVRALKGGRTLHVRDGEHAQLLGVSEFAAVPLIVEGRPVGLLLADNGITGRPIEADDIFVLELLAIHAALAIERARTSENLARKVAQLEDATRELREQQERLVRAERLSAVGEVAARVVHEVRNPLVAIGGLARSILRRRPDGAEAETLRTVVHEVLRLERVISEVLDFTHPPVPRQGTVALAEVVADAAALLRYEADKSGVELSVEVEPGPCEAACGRDDLFRAVVNLVRNAIQAMPAGGRVTLRAGRHGAAAVALAVADDGPGMPPEVRARVLEPFFTTKSTGTGLGLTIAAQIVREHHGDIEVVSREGAGTTVTLRLPAAIDGGEGKEVDDVEDPGR